MGIVFFLYKLGHKMIVAMGQGDCCQVRIPTCKSRSLCVCVFVCAGPVMKAKDKQSHVEQGVSLPATVLTLNGHLCSQAAA